MPPRSVTCIVRFRRSLSEAGNRRCRPGALCCLSVVLSTPAVLGRLRSVTVSLFADGFKVGILTPDQASRAPVRATRSRAPHAASTSLNRFSVPLRLKPYDGQGTAHLQPFA